MAGLALPSVPIGPSPIVSRGSLSTVASTIIHGLLVLPHAPHLISQRKRHHQAVTFHKEILTCALHPISSCHLRNLKPQFFPLSPLSPICPSLLSASSPSALKDAFPPPKLLSHLLSLPFNRQTSGKSYLHLLSLFPHSHCSTQCSLTPSPITPLKLLSPAISS